MAMPTLKLGRSFGRTHERSLGRSLGLKLLLVCFLVLLMGVPALLISTITFERSSRARDVMQDVSERYGGQQTVMGPVLVVPYKIQNQYGSVTEYGEHIVFAEEGEINTPDLTTRIRKRSLYKVPTYEANVEFTARFVLPELAESDAESANEIIWEPAKILVGLSDVRGVRNDVFLSLADGVQRKFEPARRFSRMDETAQALENTKAFRAGLQSVGGLQYIQVGAENLAKTGEVVTANVTLAIAGSTNLSFVPFAKSSKASLKADWPHPGFKGQYAPNSRSITKDGFTANWSVPFLARGIAGSGSAHTLNLGKMMRQKMSVQLVSPVNPYQNVSRALKYAILFVGIVFLAYFLFEVGVGVQVHPAQYVLIGLVQCIFYLLLLAFSEHIGFTSAFAIAALPTIGVSAGYAGAVFGARKYSLRAGAVFVAVYGLLYVLMRIEDFALMVGALMAFLAIVGTMYLTRNINWYGETSP